MQTTSARLISSVPQVLQGLASPGASSSLGLSQAGLDSAASLGSSGVPAPISALSSLASTSGEGATKGASAGLGTLSGLATNLASVLSGNSLATLGLGSDLVGLGSDGAGFGADGGGLGFDAYRRSMDFQGAGSILGAEGVPGFETSGELGGNLPLGGLDQGPAAGLGHANALGTLSVPPSWADAVSNITQGFAHCVSARLQAEALSGSSGGGFPFREPTRMRRQKPLNSNVCDEIDCPATRLEPPALRGRKVALMAWAVDVH